MHIVEVGRLEQAFHDDDRRTRMEELGLAVAVRTQKNACVARHLLVAKALWGRQAAFSHMCDELKRTHEVAY